MENMEREKRETEIYYKGLTHAHTHTNLQSTYLLSKIIHIIAAQCLVHGPTTFVLLEIWLKCIISPPKFLNKNLHFNKIPNDLYAHEVLRIIVLGYLVF
jgi:hypothetical protein